jgi:hypothetical protein
MSTLFFDTHRPIDIDQGTVRRFLAAFDDMRAAMRRLDRAAAGRIDPTDDGFGAFARNPRVRGEIQTVLERHGFAGVEAWERTVQAVMGATAFADPDSGLSDMTTTVANLRAEIDGDTTLSAADKARMHEELEEELRQMERMRPPAGNIEAVRPFLARLKSIAGSE